MNSLNSAIQFANENNLPVTINDVVPDGKLRRFAVSKDDHRKSGWSVCFQNHSNKSGEVFYVAVFGNYRTGEKFTYKDEKVILSREDRKNIKEQIEKARKAEEEARNKLFLETSLDAVKRWESLHEYGESEYLTIKGISNPDPETNIHDAKIFGIKFSTADGTIVIPMRDADGKLWSLQRIKVGYKNFMSGGRKSGCFHSMGEDLQSADTIRICEGFATGASILIAVGDAVVVAFDSGNLVTVAKSLKEKYPSKTFIICGDDDRFKEKNAGRIKAEEAAKYSLGTVVFPQFPESDTESSDFNDLHVKQGIDELRKQLGEVKGQRMALYALGFKEREYFFTSTSNRQIVPVSAFTQMDFLNLMPVEYWEALYPKEDGKPDYDRARSELSEKCRRMGLFNGFNVRGAGVWMDAGRIVVNMGDHLIVNGKKMGLGDIKSKFFYSLGNNLDQLHDRPLSTEECKPLIQSCLSFKWTKDDSGILLAGALVLSRVCGALPIRPHVWITGGAETGKTTLLEKLVSKIIGPNSLYVSRGTTEAGVRQALKSNSVPVLFDEFETTNTAGDAHIDAIIELCRGAWSDSHAKIVKGGASGNAVEYQARFSAIVSSIRTKLSNDADRGRFAVLELAPHGGDQTHWKRLKGFLDQITHEFSDRLFSRTIKMLPTILENQKIMQTVLAKRSGSRFGDQYGMILAGYASLIHDDVLTIEDGEWLADQVTLEEEKEITKQADHKDCLKHLWTTSISYDHSHGRVTEPIGTIIDQLQKELARSQTEYDALKRRALLNHGIRVEQDSIAVVATGHAGLQKLFNNTKWSSSWGVSLKRLENSQKKKIRIDSQTFWAIIIPNTAIYA